ncbi:MAG: glycine cleavage T C-terminal barrel domain-containing protein [Vicinamibacterales bacterium]|nr:glycine cleavage T C-terminal barrel domain-containing protein [Vicinamibacterales bacterium]
MPFSLDQYRAVRQSAGVFDRSRRGRITLRGRDRLTFLHALLTNDVAGLAPGTGCYAAMLTPQGRMIADMRVFELGDAVLLDVHRETTDVLLAKLDQMLFSEDVQIGDVSDTFGCISVQGPLAAGVVAASAGLDAGVLASWQPFQNARASWGGTTVIIARTDEFGLPGFLLFTDRAAIPSLAALAGANGAEVVEAETEEVLRVEAGQPVFLVDMTDDTIPLEAGLETTAISYTKGCFPGQEVLVRIRDRGHGRVARKLVGLVLDAGEVPERGAVVRAGDKDVGQVTSAVLSPEFGKPIALAYVHRDVSQAGTVVTVSAGGQAVPATVRVLPFC